MTKRLSILLLMLPALGATAQSVRLTHYDAPSALYANLDRLYNYNRYEKSRIELGATWVTPNETAQQSRPHTGQWTLEGYAAYGFGDKAFKYGGSAQLRLPGLHNVRLRLRGYNDVEAAASRRLEGYRMLAPDYNTSFLSSRYVGMKGARADISFSPNRLWELTLGAAMNWVDYRFSAINLVYPVQNPEEREPIVRQSCLTARLDWQKTVTLTATAGLLSPDSAANRRHGIPAGHAPLKPGYLRLLAQYDGTPGDFGLHVFGQVGYTTEGTPFCNMFDMSGTARSVYFFRNTFLTVPPNKFTANMFAYTCLNYTAPIPLWETSWSQPQPFLQLSAMWGRLHGQSSLGHLMLRDVGLRKLQALPLQAPYMGLMEAATGFDGLLRWGLFDFGVGIAYQLCPLKAPYLNENPLDNFALAVVATFVLDKMKRDGGVPPQVMSGEPPQVINR